MRVNSSFKKGKMFRAAFNVVTDFSTSEHSENLIGPLFCLDLSLSRSTDH